MLIRLFLLTALAILPACSLFSRAHEPTIEQAAPYTGPAVDFDSTSRTHIAQITCPTPGWSASHDLTREGWPSHEVFITLVPPPADAINAQVLTTILVDTGVRAESPCRVYIRRADQAPDSIAAGSYTLAASADPAPAR
ncbi:MAG: hypothetical protein H6812_02450 [Phycisphaeraceae bacterium]|nr:hypothetical protein [Phycisphaerales bacterium]MCB9842098.1 hypothetical protein [Phycisphaeraceae bacterium]